MGCVAFIELRNSYTHWIRGLSGIFYTLSEFTDCMAFPAYTMNTQIVWCFLHTPNTRLVWHFLHTRIHDAHAVPPPFGPLLCDFRVALCIGSMPCRRTEGRTGSRKGGRASWDCDNSWTSVFHVLIAILASCLGPVWTPVCLSFIFSLQPLF